MDPTANLEEQLRLAAKILFDMDKDVAPNKHDAYNLAMLVESLHNWMEKGGAKPKQWKR
jgi:hypothetical protein